MMSPSGGNVPPRPMDLDQAFANASNLPTIEERVGVMSIDSMKRQWHLLKVIDGSRLFLVHFSRQSFILGTMGIREDGKRCIDIDSQISLSDPEDDNAVEIVWRRRNPAMQSLEACIAEYLQNPLI
ncbi:hypothetical protein [Cupriavidus taiwanensis]|uniref:Uncharacterized protein n=1 Tax=Cupriavidus taiwanensis TaxID=164546 RepID=A0A7Z7JFD3_9BURK|nr:hypothetical protein [Cupriavidus taiwanensis]SOZ17173.1 hypothetical protein CBM2597_U10050 [Cupriavidus taiwanensis]SOZ96515.1 hypothetical protein CBM2598_U10301 [Cupriavidus taiwanensis]SPC25556.1 hypothetical protein CBM2594_U10057 [Cupriavidus taiwanensis]